MLARLERQCTARLHRIVRDDHLSGQATQAFASHTDAFTSRMVCCAGRARSTALHASGQNQKPSIYRGASLCRTASSIYSCGILPQAAFWSKRSCVRTRDTTCGKLASDNTSPPERFDAPEARLPLWRLCQPACSSDRLEATGRPETISMTPMVSPAFSAPRPTVGEKFSSLPAAGR